MRRTMLLCLAIILLSATISSGRSAAPSDAGEMSPPSGTIPATLFGMHIHVRGPHAPWPTVTFGSFRMLENLTSWAAVNTGPGTYNWRVVDAILAALKEHGVDDVVYTFDKTPSWASAHPDHDCVEPGPMSAMHVAHKMFPGLCDPPSDLNPDGSGSDQHWKDYVTAIVTHAKNSRGARIKYWEIWNEPHNTWYWTGTYPQMVRMAKDANSIIKSIDSDALVLSPSGSPKFLEGFLAAGGGQYVDVIADHGYIHSGRPGDFPYPPKFISVVKQKREIMARYGADNKPLWDTEGSWGNAQRMGFDEDYQEAFLAQYYILHWSLNVPRFYWFAWNDGAVGTLWIQQPGNPEAGTVAKAASAYNEIYRWLVGATMTRACSLDGGVWSCGLTRDGREQIVAWADHDPRNYTPKSPLKRMRDIDGNESAVSGPIKVGAKPVLLSQ